MISGVSSQVLGSEAIPLYPVQLLGTPEMHQHIPHMPITRNIRGGMTIPLGDHESQFDKWLGIFVAMQSDKSYELKLDTTVGYELPSSLGHGRQLKAPIAGFILDFDKGYWSKKVSAQDLNGLYIPLTRGQSSSLSPFLEGAIHTARYKKGIFDLALRNNVEIL